jgi:hypothetical protein
VAVHDEWEANQYAQQPVRGVVDVDEVESAIPQTQEHEDQREQTQRDR